jgi:hypothetical protein
VSKNEIILTFQLLVRFFGFFFLCGAQMLLSENMGTINCIKGRGMGGRGGED